MIIIRITLRKNKPLYPTAKRVGRPKLNWAKQTYTEAWRVANRKPNNTRHGIHRVQRTTR